MEVLPEDVAGAASVLGSGNRRSRWRGAPHAAGSLGSSMENTHPLPGKSMRTKQAGEADEQGILVRDDQDVKPAARLAWRRDGVHGQKLREGFTIVA